MKEIIEQGKTALGIEFGSTRIKAILIDEAGKVLAQGDHGWENRLENGVWTYTEDDIWTGLQDCYSNLAKDVKAKYNVTLTTVGALGFSAMMHGYLAFDKAGKLLVPFRTWRNTMTEQAAAELSEAFNFNVPQRWSIAHLYQAILNKEEHIKDVDFFTTLDGFVQWKLTGTKNLGIGEASGMFPIDSAKRCYDEKMIAKFDELAAAKGFTQKLADLLPEILQAGEQAGTLTEEGAKLLDVSGNLKAGIPLCPSEGDAGTGMVATNAIAPGTGNVSAGTSVFSMVVVDKALAPHEEIDMVTTPVGDPVAMVHCNNCTSDLNAWVGLFKEFADTFGMDIDMNDLYGTLYRKALLEDADCGGLLAYNYFSGEGVTKFNEGRPLFVRKPDAKFTLSNFMRTHLYASLSTLKYGNDILLQEENVPIERITGHGGLFKTKGVGQSVLAAALDAPISVMETAGEGGAWGMALLALYMNRADKSVSLADFLDNVIFADAAAETVQPDPVMVEGFNEYMKGYKAGLAIQKAATESF